MNMQPGKPNSHQSVAGQARRGERAPIAASRSRRAPRSSYVVSAARHTTPTVGTTTVAVRLSPAPAGQGNSRRSGRRTGAVPTAAHPAAPAIRSELRHRLHPTYVATTGAAASATNGEARR